MMSKKKWCVLLFIFILYILAGTGIFYNIEYEEEKKRNIEQEVQKGLIEDLFDKLLQRPNDNKDVRNDEKRLFDELSDYCGKPIQRYMTQLEPQYKWDFYHALFFVVTVVSTIGYGNLAPTTMFTRMFMIFYSLIGIPMNGIVMVTLGSYFGKSFTKLYQRWKNSKTQYDTTKLGLISQIFLYLIPGFTFFIFLPAACMVLFENWTYDVAVYYCYVSLTTIGFGDFIAGVDNVNNFMYITYWCYKIFLVVWIIGGLGYVVMILGFITKAMQSKKIQEIEHIITKNIKQTPLKIRQELRTILQEFLFMKVQPVYKDEFDYIPKHIERSQSCPDLTIYRNFNSPTMARKRALSECPRSFILHRIQSDTDLERIDKELTFKPNDEFMHQKELLCRVVDALSNLEDREVHPYEHAAYDGFTDSQILSSERFGSHWSLRSQKMGLQVPTTERRRAVSDVRVPAMHKVEAHNWDLPAQKHHRPRTFSQPSSETEENAGIFQRLKNRFLSSSREKCPDVEQGRRSSMVLSPEERYVRQTNRGRGSVMSAQEQEAVLETTSIADFIRALSAITVPDTMLGQNEGPKRKMGTAGLSPPKGPSPPRVRRLAIRPNVPVRRTSLMPDTHPVHPERRLSLRPVEEHLLAPPPYSPPGDVRQRRYSVARISNAPAFSISPVQKKLNKRENSKDDS